MEYILAIAYLRKEKKVNSVTEFIVRNGKPASRRKEKSGNPSI